MAEDLAHLRDVEPQVDDQVARERVPQIVDAQSRQVLRVKSREVGCSPEPPPLHVAPTERRPEPTAEDVVPLGRVRRSKLVLLQESAELGKERDHVIVARFPIQRPGRRLVDRPSHKVA